MSDRYLEVTYRDGEPLAAYLYLERRRDDGCARTEKVREGVVVDYGQDGHPVGIEITEPRAVHPDDINAVLQGLGLAEMDRRDLAPVSGGTTA